MRNSINYFTIAFCKSKKIANNNFPFFNNVCLSILYLVNVELSNIHSINIDQKFQIQN